MHINWYPAYPNQWNCLCLTMKYTTKQTAFINFKTNAIKLNIIQFVLFQHTTVHLHLSKLFIQYYLWIWIRDIWSTVRIQVCITGFSQLQSLFSIIMLFINFLLAYNICHWPKHKLTFGSKASLNSCTNKEKQQELDNTIRHLWLLKYIKIPNLNILSNITSVDISNLNWRVRDQIIITNILLDSRWYQV